MPVVTAANSVWSPMARAPARAARAAALASAEWQPDLIASIGFCGALDPALGIGDVFVATAVSAAGGRFDTQLPQSNLPCASGVLASIDRVAQTAEEKAALQGRRRLCGGNGGSRRGPHRCGGRDSLMLRAGGYRYCGPILPSRLQPGAAFRRPFRYNKAFNVCF